MWIVISFRINHFFSEYWFVMFYVRFMVSKSVQQCKLRSLVCLGELERVNTVLHSMYVQAKAEEGFHIQETETKIRSLTNVHDMNSGQQDNAQVMYQLVYSLCFCIYSVGREFILCKPVSQKITLQLWIIFHIFPCVLNTLILEGKTEYWIELLYIW